ncbi:S8 family serine peptidase [Clostridium sp. P21]|uniref:S8 family serine peptidase n=1 Tax=Clostridium muellerianum TaxID=2716538 RepID=A0A7Y0HM31_9CLOT|nr:S8 family serine peptidase [Clostridium muellerianum]NMM62579.1 S8 family serine peptidase [Clostridium muellerianum]
MSRKKIYNTKVQLNSAYMIPCKFICSYCEQNAIWCPIVSYAISNLPSTSERFSDDIYKQNLYLTRASEDPLVSMKNIRADLVKQTGITGKGVKIGILELDEIDTKDPELSHLNIVSNPNMDILEKKSPHTTLVAKIIAGKTLGIVPNATLYYSRYLTEKQFRKGIEWLIKQGCNIINFSAAFEGANPKEELGTYTELASWMDTLAVIYKVHFVKSAGNNRYEYHSPYHSSLETYWITNPGMAYNIMTVGAIDDLGTSEWIDDKWGQLRDGTIYSAYEEMEGTALKPDLCSPGTNIFSPLIKGENSGTSFAAPHVTGVIAQMIEIQPELSWDVGAVRAILAAGTIHRTADDYGTYPESPFYSNKEGFGVVDAKGAFDIIKKKQYKTFFYHRSAFPYRFVIDVQHSETLKRISLSWLKLNRIGSDGIPIKPQLANLDLYIFDPDRIEVARSTSKRSNIEIVEFSPKKTGYYTVFVVAESISRENEYERIAVAWM